MKNTQKPLTLFLCSILIATAFSSVPLSASAEDNNAIASQIVVVESATENATEEGTYAELIDTVDKNTYEVPSEPTVETNDYLRSEKPLENQSSATKETVVFSYSPITLGVGETYTFSKSSLNTLSSTSTTYKWSSTNSNVVAVNSSGKITAKKAGNATISVTASNGKKATCAVTVKNAPTKISLNKTKITLGVGEKFDLNSSLPSGTASYGIKYKSNATGVATVASTNGIVTAKKAGTVVITATTHNGKKATCTVTVKNAPTKISLNKTKITLGVGEKFDLNSSLPSGTASYSVKYTSNATSVATVNASGGLVTAKKVGTAVITATTYNGKKATCTVTVKNAPTKISLNKTKITLKVGEKFDLNSSLPSGTASYSVKYTSNATSIATVNASGGLVTAKKVGTAVITATTYNGKKATCTVTVKDKDNVEEYIDEVLKLTNEERKKEGLPALTKRTDIEKLAGIRAKELSVEFSHTRPNGEAFYSIINENGITYTALAENISSGPETPESVVNAWMNSEGHKKNILNSRYKGLGVGCYIDGEDYYWVQIFIN